MTPIRATSLHVSLCRGMPENDPFQVVLLFFKPDCSRATLLTSRMWRLFLNNAQNVMEARALGGMTVTLELDGQATALRLAATPSHLLVELSHPDGDAVAAVLPAELARLTDPDNRVGLKLLRGNTVEVLCAPAEAA